MDWKHYKPFFEYQKDSKDSDLFWGGHIFFAYDLVLNTRPDVVVELGTHHGTSFFSFCQAVKDSGLNTKLYAIDTWKGDKHAGFYDETVLQSVEEIRKSHYENVNAYLVRKEFNEAIHDFSDNSIDILHIDGLHTYEAVKHDYETWLPKVKKDGIILFHDIDAIDHKDFGVYKLWNELKKGHDFVEFHHSCGLGVLFRDSKKFGYFRELKNNLERNYGRKPRVSVVMPLYNHDRFVAKAIQSILDQTLQDFEIIITDDASTDDSLKVVESFSDDRIKIYKFDKNRGISSAMNNCIRHAQGEYIAHLNADDVFLPEKLQKQLDFLHENENFGVVFTHVSVIDDTGKKITDKNHPYFNIFDQPNRNRFEWINHFFYKGNCLCHSSAMIRKECFEEIGYYDSRFHGMQDFEFWTRILGKYDIHILSENLTQFRVTENDGNASGLSESSENRKIWENMKILERFLLLSVDDIEKSFDKYEKFNRPLEKRLIPHYLAMLALENDTPFHKCFALNTLYGIIEKDTLLKEELLENLRSQNFINLTGSIDLFNINKIKSLSKQLEKLSLSMRDMATLELNNKNFEKENIRLKKENDFIKSSKFWKLRNIYLKITRNSTSIIVGKLRSTIFQLENMSPGIFKKGRAILAKHGIKTMLWCTWKYFRYGRSYFSHGIDQKIKIFSSHSGSDYKKWIDSIEPKIMRTSLCKNGPKISIITPIYNTDPKLLNRCIESVIMQKYPNWELCLHDDCSTNKITRQILKDWKNKDSRIKVSFGNKNLHIAGASNESLKLATGKYIALLDHDDELSPHALNEAAHEIMANDEPDFIYTDKDKIDENGNRFEPLFKPDWSPEMMYSANYLTHLNIIKTSLVRKIGGWDEKSSGAQDWDLFLRITSVTDKIRHIPKILYHWRVHKMSTSSSISTKPYALNAQEYSLNKHFKNRHLQALAKVSSHGEVKVYWSKDKSKIKFSLVILANSTSDAISFIDRNLFLQENIKMTGIVLIINDDSSMDIVNSYKNFELRFVTGDNLYSSIKNICNEVSPLPIAFINAKILDISERKIEHLLAWTSIPKTGAIGCAISDENNILLDIGQIIGLTSISGHIFRNCYLGQASLIGHSNWIRNLNIVSNDFFVISSEATQEISKYKEGYPNIKGEDETFLFLMIQLRSFGFRNIFVPQIAIRKAREAKIRNVPSDFIMKYMESKGFLTDDEYYNKNLSLVSFEPRIDYALPHERPQLHLRPYDYLPAREIPPLSEIPSNSLREYHSEIAILESCDINLSDTKSSWKNGHRVQKVAFFLPTFTSVYAGIFNILNFAEQLKNRNIEVVFYIANASQEMITTIRNLICNHKPSLSNIYIFTISSTSPHIENSIDLGIATLWTTAYTLLKLNIPKKAYFIQDNEASFYPGGAVQSAAIQTYSFGFCGITNTPGLSDMYSEKYNGKSLFVPSFVDLSPYFSEPIKYMPNKPARVLFYGRPENPRNGFSLAILGMQQLKKKYKEKIEIYSAGAEWTEFDYETHGTITNLGKVPFSQLPKLYSSMDAGLMFMYSGHPGVVASELMASGVPVVVNKNEDSAWKNLYRNEETCLLSDSTPASVAISLEKLLLDISLRKKIINNARETVRQYYGEYNERLESALSYLLN